MKEFVVTHPYAEIDAVLDDVREEFLEWLSRETWTKPIPVGFLIARLYYDDQFVRQIDAFEIAREFWPTDRNYAAVASGKLALSEREGLDTTDIVSRYAWLLRSGDCRWGGAGRVTPKEGRTKILVSFSGLLPTEDIRIYKEYGYILLKHLNIRALARLEALDSSGTQNGGSFLP